MAHPPKKDTTVSDITNVMLNNSSISQVSPMEYDAHFSGIDSGYQSPDDIKRSRKKEDLPFQEWTAKYHQ